MDFSDGTSHAYYKAYINKNPEHRWLAKFNIVAENRYKYISKIKTDMPLVHTPILPVDMYEIHSLIPEYKLIYIQIDDMDIPICSANHYYKQPAGVAYFTEIATRLFSITDISLLNTEQRHVLITHTEILSGYYGYMMELDRLLSSCPDQFRNSLYCINFSDIINNPSKVKNLLENVTNKKMSLHAHRQYDRYVETQIEFRNQKGF